MHRKLIIILLINIQIMLFAHALGSSRLQGSFDLEFMKTFLDRSMLARRCLQTERLTKNDLRTIIAKQAKSNLKYNNFIACILDEMVSYVDLLRKDCLDQAVDWGFISTDCARAALDPSVRTWSDFIKLGPCAPSFRPSVDETVTEQAYGDFVKSKLK